MENTPFGSITEHFANVTDPRSGQNIRHKLMDIIVIAICGVICVADGWVEIENFGRQKQAWLAKYLELPSEAIPTFREKYLDYRRREGSISSDTLTIREIQAFASVRLLGDILHSMNEVDPLPEDLTVLRTSLAEALRELSEAQPRQSVLGSVAFDANGQNRNNALLLQAIDDRLVTVYPPDCAIQDPKPIFP